ncbi:hypothetical protein COOONC_28347 [Cooperia oncophora]
MDAKVLYEKMEFTAIQNDRDRIGPTKKAKMSSGSDEDQAVTPHRMQDQLVQEIVEHLTQVEGLCQELRRCVMRDVSTVQQALSSPCLLFETPELTIDVSLLVKLSFHIASFEDTFRC